MPHRDTASPAGRVTRWRFSRVSGNVSAAEDTYDYASTQAASSRGIRLFSTGSGWRGWTCRNQRGYV
jgi:hypothetical protein